jgi:hypothetical protein
VAASAGRGPDIVIAGAMKCATTQLHHLLGQHRHIATGGIKELNFFSDGANFARGLVWYEQQFAGAPHGALRLDSSPNYSKRHLWPQTAERLHRASPDATIVYIVREPLDRMRSHYVHSVAEMRERRSFDSVVRERDDPMVLTTMYHWQLEPFVERFGTNQVMVLRFDDVVRDPQGMVDRITDFHGLDRSQVSPMTRNQNSSADKTGPSRLALITRSRRARNLLRRINPSLADAPLVPPVATSESVAIFRDVLRDDLLALNDSGLVDVSDWLR